LRDHFAATQSEDLITEIRGSSNAVIFGSNFDLASFVSFSTDTPEWTCYINLNTKLRSHSMGTIVVK